MAVYSCSTAIIPISTHNMTFGRKPTCSRSALITTDRSSLVPQLPQMTNDRIKPVSSQSCQTNNTHQTSSYLRRRSLVKVMPSLSKKTTNKNDTTQQRNDSATSKKANNHRHQITSISSSSVTRKNNGNYQQQQQSTDNGILVPHRQTTPGIPRRSSLIKTPGRPSSNRHTTSGSDDETNSARNNNNNNNKHGSVLNPTVPTAVSSAAVPASPSAQKQKQRQQQKYPSRGGTSPISHQALPQHRRLSSVGIVKQNKTETLTSPPSLTKLQNTRKTLLGPHPAGSVTSDSGSDGDDAASTMDNQQQQIHMKQQQQQHNRAQHSQSQLQVTTRRINHQRHPHQQNDSLLQYHQRRTSIVSLSPLPHPNGVSSSSSSTLVRRRSFADISPGSCLAPSTSSTLVQHHHHHHQQQQNDQENKQNQQNLRTSQSHLRHPSWLDSAGFMRPSKCSICHPPPPKKSVITPPVGMGVPKFVLPPPDTSTSSGIVGGVITTATTATTTPTTTTTTSTSKYGIERRPSSRNSFVNEKHSKHMHSITSTDNGKHKSHTMYNLDGVARMDQRRRLSLPNSGNTMMDYSKTAATTTTTTTTKKKIGVERRSSFYNISSSRGIVTSTVNHTTRRLSSKRMVAPRTKTGKQQSPDTPILDKEFAHSPSSSSSLTEANTDTNSSSSSNPSPITANDESRPSTPMDMKHKVAQLMESDYLQTLDGGKGDTYPEAHEPGLLKLQPSPLVTTTTTDHVVTQCDGNSDMIQHRVDTFEQLQTFLDLSPTAETYTKEDHQQQTTDFEIPPASLISVDTSDAAQCTSSSSSSTSSSLSEMTLQLQDSSNHTTTTTATNAVYRPSPSSTPIPLSLPPPPPPSSVLSDLEQWTDMVRLTIGRWFTDFNHGHLEHYEKDADGSITTMTITGFVITMETDLVQPFSSLAEKIHQHRYTLCLEPEQRQHTFVTMSASSDGWILDDQVNQCQFKSKSTQCECEFDWMNRRHHCRRCGHIFCKTHSSNRLPLFTKKSPNEIKWSRVCDSCCSDLVGDALIKV